MNILMVYWHCLFCLIEDTKNQLGCAHTGSIPVDCLQFLKLFLMSNWALHFTRNVAGWMSCHISMSDHLSELTWLTYPNLYLPCRTNLTHCPWHTVSTLVYTMCPWTVHTSVLMHWGDISPLIYPLPPFLCRMPFLAQPSQFILV